MKKLTKIGLDELAFSMSVINEVNKRQFIGGGDGTQNNPYTPEQYWLQGYGSDCVYKDFDGSVCQGLSTITVSASSYGQVFFKGDLSDAILMSQQKPSDIGMAALDAISGNKVYGQSIMAETNYENTLFANVAANLANISDISGQNLVFSSRDGQVTVRISGSSAILFNGSVSDLEHNLSH
jgi:hypothetical protein